GNPYLIIHAGHLNLAIIGHYNFATTILVRIMYIMLNAIKEAESAAMRPHTLTLPRAKPGYSNHFQSLKH
ncbi:hypothetical protein, partial [Klebsiella sp. FR21TRMT6331]|uniref:hypothetical protein n=1 Tax=Klebsiella sp. FR21TRMT6331 TaxID=3381299 RepID=UPI003A96ADA3